MAHVLSTSETIALYLQARSHELSPLTVAGLRCNLTNFAVAAGDPPVKALEKGHVEEWMRQSGLASSTVRTRLSQLRCFCEWAVEHGHLRRDPTAGVRGPRQPRRLPRGLKLDEAQAVLAQAADERDRLVLLLMLQEGLRRREVAGLTMGDIDTIERTIFVVGKGGHERVLPISSETWGALTVYLSTCRIVAGPLIRSAKNGRSAVTPATIGRLVSGLMMAAGVKQRAYDGRSGHSCRHTAATDSLRAGAHVRDVQKMLGHLSLTSTEVYLPLVVNDLREAMSGRRYGAEARPPEPTEPITP